MEFLFQLFATQIAACQKEGSGAGDWICAKCASKWRDSIHGEGWLPVGCLANDKRAETRERTTSQPATAA
jgi:hypothetical protein